MPLFSDKFNPRLSKPRKSTSTTGNLIGRSSFSEENVDSLTEFKMLSIQLGDSLNLQFDGTNGEWKTNHADSEEDAGDDEDIHEDDGRNIDNSGDKTMVKKRSTIIKDTNSSAIVQHKSDLAKLRKANESLQEENRLLKLKVELLVDWVIAGGKPTD